MVICSVRLLHKCNNEVEFPEKIKFHTRKELNAALSSLRREGKPSKEVKLFRKEAQKTRRCVSCNLAKEKYEENCRIFEESRRRRDSSALAAKLPACRLGNLRHELLREGLDLLVGERRLLRLEDDCDGERLPAGADLRNGLEGPAVDTVDPADVLDVSPNSPVVCRSLPFTTNERS